MSRYKNLKLEMLQNLYKLHIYIAVLIKIWYDINKILYYMEESL